MPRRHRLRRVLKWSGTLACLAIVFAFEFSRQRFTQWCSSTDAYTVTMGHGAVAFIWTPPRYRDKMSVISGWYTGQYDTSSVQLRHCSWWVEFENTQWFLRVAVPLWMLFLCTAAPTATLWLLNRRDFPPGHCAKCGYNLTGNVSGRCPECGHEIERIA